MSELLTEIVALGIYMFNTRKLVGYPVRKVLTDLLQNIGLAMVMGLAVVLVRPWLHFGSFLDLVISVSVGGAVYLGISLITRKPQLTYLWTKARSILCRGR